MVAPHPCIVVAQTWPSVLIALASLRVPVEGVSAPRYLEAVFNTTKYSHVTWHHQSELAALSNRRDVVYFLSGSTSYLRAVWGELGRPQNAVVHVEFPMESRSRMRRRWGEVNALLAEMGMKAGKLRWRGK